LARAVNQWRRAQVRYLSTFNLRSMHQRWTVGELQVNGQVLVAAGACGQTGV